MQNKIKNTSNENSHKIKQSLFEDFFKTEDPDLDLDQYTCMRMYFFCHWTNRDFILEYYT